MLRPQSRSGVLLPPKTGRGQPRPSAWAPSPQTSQTTRSLFSSAPTLTWKLDSASFFGDRPARAVNHAGDSRVVAHVRGSTATPLITLPIGAYFDEQVERYSNRKCLRVMHQDIDWSWEDLRQQVDAFATGLYRLGFKKGDRLGVWLPNTSEWVVAKFAAAKLGLILVNVNPAYRSHELEHAANLVELKGLLITPELKSSNYVKLLHDLIPELPSFGAGAHYGRIHSSKIPSLEYIIHNTSAHLPGMVRFEDVLHDVTHDEKVVLQQTAKSQDPHEAFNIQFTSGTTGNPKGATLTHSNILNNGLFAGERMRLSPSDALVVPVPLYHCFGLVLGNLAALTHGSKLVYPSAQFDPLAVLQAVAAERATALHGVPTMFIAELDHPEFSKYEMRSLRTGIMAGSNCPTQLMRRVIKEMHMGEVSITYGMTETSPASFQTRPDAPLDKRTDTVGTIHDHVECKVVDEKEHTVPINTSGELWTKGYNVMLGYWKQPKKTEESVMDGWMRTGDLAQIDEDGYCRVVGRIKDLIIRGGENIYPREIEEFLYHHPCIADVQIIGVPDAKYGEQVCAWIKLKPGKTATEQEIKDYCKEKIAHFKIPHYILFVDSYPMTISGKVKKFEMRHKTIELLHLESHVKANR